MVLQYSIAIPPPPINIMQLAHDDAQHTDGFYLPKLPNCLFKSVNDKQSFWKVTCHDDGALKLLKNTQMATYAHSAPSTAAVASEFFL